MLRDIHTKMIRTGADGDRTVEGTATMRAESVIESDTSMVHTIMHADGSGVVCTYKRAPGETQWAIDSRLRFHAGGPTRFTPRAEPSRPVCAADHYLNS